jgi:hypothetical protein
MYCPKCGAEYREGFAECADCQIPLVAQKPVEPEATGDPELQLVTVLESTDPLVIASAKGLLEEAGIPFYVLGDEFGKRFGPVGDFMHPWCRVQVGRDRETEARALLQSLAEAAVSNSAADDPGL